MRSQSLFNFFTKSAVTVHSGPNAAKDYIKKQQQRAGGRTSQGSVSPMSDQQRWASDLDYSLRNHGGSVRDAYSHFDTTMTERYGNKDPRYTAAMAYAKKRLATDQFNRMWDNYHAYTDPDLHPNDATAASRMNSRMIIGDAEQAGYIFTPNEDDSGWNPGNMTYLQFGDFFTDPTTGKMMSKEEAEAKWTKAWEDRDAADSRGRNNNASVGARRPVGGSVPGSGVPQDDSWRDAASQQWDATVTAYNNNSKNAGTPLTFQGGHIVNYDPRYVKDWTRYTKNNPANNNVGGTWYNNEQYLSYHDISDQLYNSMVNSGMNPKKAKAEASRLTKAYLDDQMEIARGGKARNQWMEQPPASGTPADPTAVAGQPTRTDTAYTLGSNTDLITGANTNSHVMRVDGTYAPFDANGTITLGIPSTDTPSGIPSTDTPSGNLNHLLTGHPASFESITTGKPVQPGDDGYINLPDAGQVAPTAADADAGAKKVVTPVVPKQPEIRPVVTTNSTTPKSDNNVTSTATTPITWSVNDGLKDPTGYIKYHTRTRDVDTLRKWNNGKLSTREYYAGMAGSHYNNMQNLYALASNPNLNPTQKRAVMRALYREAVLFGEFAQGQNAKYRGYLDDPYNPNGLGGGTTERVDNTLAEHGIMDNKKYMKHNSFIPDDIKDFIASYDNY